MKQGNDRSRRAVLLLSGGMDSCVTGEILRDRGYDLAILHTTYGQRTAERELRAFREIADYWKIPEERRMVVDIGYLVEIGGSSLTDRTIQVSDADLESKEIPTSYVPFRNGNLLAIAASWAEVIGAGTIAIGAVEEDSSGYPDCRPGFFKALEKAIDLGTRPETNIKLETPVIAMRKSEIVRRGHDLGAPLHLTWSCYRSNGPTPCGTCDSCALRARAFQEAGLHDRLHSD